ncbi:HIRAN domain-containing protein [Propionivibrio dicarboxylicus]|uniref:HIRAN domain-containing protein n=1 Tax=Propionivibrio dicarboxylicus TaxID=83767 RepID=A0A1G8FGB8_9RHOO|nr:HIRAN domain-containing protein [Propionivibrio dicarboxylicus]SDH81116.1 HIRAN domain-containing protein [Propionivibrio dicarboxylicus]
MRSPLIRRLRLALLAALTTPAIAADAIRILVQRSPLAGSQYYTAPQRWRELQAGDRLELVREADNRHDRNAVRIDWRAQTLGYVPRAENRSVARALDAGERLVARIAALREDPDPWRRIEFEIFVVLGNDPALKGSKPGEMLD